MDTNALYALAGEECTSPCKGIQITLKCCFEKGLIVLVGEAHLPQHRLTAVSNPLP